MLLYYKKPISIAKVFLIPGMRTEVLLACSVHTTVYLAPVPCEGNALIFLSSACTDTCKHCGLSSHVIKQRPRLREGRERQRFRELRA